jgi:methyl-accepting chemotaxis protein
VTAEEVEIGVTTPPVRPRFGMSVRWKMLIAFTGAFTIVFAFIAIWVYSFTTNTTQARLVSEMKVDSEQVAESVSAADFAALVKQWEALPAGTEVTAAEMSDTAHFTEMAEELRQVRKGVPTASIYSYYRDATDGRLHFGAIMGYDFDESTGIRPAADAETDTDPGLIQLMNSGLEQTTEQDAYVNEYGGWISAYTPIRDADGTVVGGIGMDYPLTYVAEVQQSLRSTLIPVMIGSYAVLLLLVIVLATSLTRPLKRLTAATQRVADGEYDLDVQAIVPNRFPDEMWTLAESFASMAIKVATRERTLTSEVKRLKVEIDHARREQAVKEITESDSFSDLMTKAARMRRRARGEPEDDEPGVEPVAGLVVEPGVETVP